MLGKELRDGMEKDTFKRKQAALQTKGQKRWRMKGSQLNALVNEYARESRQAWNSSMLADDYADEFSY
jgi:hypothetical protein